MFNSAFSEAGAACTIKTVEKLTHIRIDHHVVIDFGGFKDMVNALGGVKICVPQDVSDPESHLFITKGEHVVKGSQALAYVRTRHGLGNGSDIDRINRQQAFLGSMISKIKSKGLLLRPDRLLSFLGAATNSISTDPGLGSLNALRKLAQDVKNIDTKNVTFLTAPNQPYPADPNRVELKPSAATVWNALRYDQPLPGKKKPTPTATETGPPLKTPPENIRVQVLNGSTTKGEAARIAQELTADGFQVVDVAQRPAPRLHNDQGPVRPRLRRVGPHPRRRGDRLDRHRVTRHSAARSSSSSAATRRRSPRSRGRLDGVAAARGDTVRQHNRTMPREATISATPDEQAGRARVGRGGRGRAAVEAARGWPRVRFRQRVPGVTEYAERCDAQWTR